MSKRFFTADFHIGFELLLDKKVMGDDARPFESISQMNQAILHECNNKAKVYYKTNKLYDENGNPILNSEGKEIIVKSQIDKDVIIHVGDVAFFKAASDQSFGDTIKPQEFIQKINAQFINIRGNHDVNNKVKSLCTSMQTNIGKRFPNVTVGHYPSYDPHARGTFREGWIHLCGHVHKKFKHCLDITNKVLNINVGLDVWDYKIVSEEDLIRYIISVLNLPTNKLNKIKIIDGKPIEVNSMPR